MTNLPTKVSAASLPAHLPPQIQRGLDIAVGRLDPPITGYRTSYTISAADAPSPELRQSLDVRRSRIDEWLRPAGVEHAAEQYRILLGVMAHRDDDAEGARLHAATFVQDLMDLPLFALTKACSDFRRGVVGDGKWMPEPGVVRIVAQGLVADLRKERREIDAVLTAEVVTVVENPDRKAELLAATREWIGKSRADAEVQRRGGMTPAEIADAQTVAAMIRDNTHDPRPAPTLSPYLRGKLGLTEPMNQEDAA